MTTTEPSTNVRERLAIALDVPTLPEAVTLAGAVAPHFGVAKVGLQLFSGHGPSAVEAIQSTGLDVFLDVKLHDIPNTVGGAARQLGKLGVRYVTVHAAGGVEMVHAAAEGLAEGAAAGGHATPMVLAITVLTSIDPGDAAEHAKRLAQRAAMAMEGGAGGVVCAVPDLDVVKSGAPGLLTVTPGIRLAGGSVDDQKRTGGPGDAVRAGAGLLVVGRAVSGADDPAGTANLVATEVAEAVHTV